MRDTLTPALPLLAGSSARRNPVQAMDRNGHPGHPSPDRWLRAQPIHRQLPVASEPRRHRAAGRRDRLHRARHGAGRHRRRHRSVGRFDVRADRLLRALSARRAGLAGAGRGGRDAALRRAARRRQRHPDRLSAAARLHHHADHADHLSLGLRSPDPALLQRDRVGLPRHPVLGFHRRRHCLRRSERGAGLYRRRHLRSHLHDAAATGLAHHRDRRLASLGLQFRHSRAPHDRALLRRERRADQRRRAVLRRHGSAPSAATSASGSR